jgi:hypothetical protein
MTIRVETTGPTADTMTCGITCLLVGRDSQLAPSAGPPLARGGEQLPSRRAGRGRAQAMPSKPAAGGEASRGPSPLGGSMAAIGAARSSLVAPARRGTVS